MILRPATDSEKRLRDDACYPAWGPPLPRPEWYVREARLRAHRWSRAAMTTWLWCEGEQVLSSCETFRMDSWAGDARGNTYGVASVFTEPELRGRGHAVSMLQALNTRLRKQDPRAQATILFSDVGAAIYRRAGFVERPAFDLERPPSTEAPEVEWLDEAQLGSAHAALHPPRDPFVVWPSWDQLDWHLERERLYAEALSRPRPAHVGARRGGALGLWAGVFRSETLVLLLLQGGSAQETEAVMQAAAFAAQQAGLKKVSLWQTPQSPQGPAVSREGSLPMIAPLDPRVTAEAWRSVPRALWI